MRRLYGDMLADNDAMRAVVRRAGLRDSDGARRRAPWCAPSWCRRRAVPLRGAGPSVAADGAGGAGGAGGWAASVGTGATPATCDERPVRQARDLGLPPRAELARRARDDTVASTSRSMSCGRNAPLSLPFRDRRAPAGGRAAAPLATWMSPWNDCSSTRALPAPSVKLKRLLPSRPAHALGQRHREVAAEVAAEGPHEHGGVGLRAQADADVAVVGGHAVDALVGGRALRSARRR